MRKPKENAVSSAKNKGGKPRKYGAGDGKICQPFSISAPADLILQARNAADQIGCTASDIAVAGLRSILSRSPDRLRDAVAGRG